MLMKQFLILNMILNSFLILCCFSFYFSTVLYFILPSTVLLQRHSMHLCLVQCCLQLCCYSFSLTSVQRSIAKCRVAAVLPSRDREEQQQGEAGGGIQRPRAQVPGGEIVFMSSKAIH